MASRSGSDDAPPNDEALGERTRRVVVAGHRGDRSTARAGLADDAPSVRAAAWSALARMGDLVDGDVARGAGDPSAAVRRRVAELAGRTGSSTTPDATVPATLIGLLDDPDPTVVEAAAWALGEIESAPAPARLVTVARDHDDALCRESAIAALGAIGDPATLPTVIGGLEDRPAVRRRAVVALAAFTGPSVEAALERATGDRDRQTVQIAEDLLGR